jgi:endonuclease/exonuclease/phosphatase (EEP) superfamily protein YafD
MAHLKIEKNKDFHNSQQHTNYALAVPIMMVAQAIAMGNGSKKSHQHFLALAKEAERIFDFKFVKVEDNALDTTSVSTD